MKPFKYIFLLLFTLFGVGCGTTAVSETPTPQPTAVSEVQPTEVPTNTAVVPATDTAVPPTAVPAPATATAVPTSEVEATGGVTPTATALVEETVEVVTETAVSPSSTTAPVSTPATPTALAVTMVAPPPVGNVEAPPYAPSACSDKYPCNDDEAGWVARIQVPAGFSDSYYGRIDGSPTSITFGPDGLLYIATMTGSIYRMDSSGTASLYVSGFIVPTGLAFQPGTDKLYVSSRVVNQDIDGEAKVSYVQGGGVTDIIRGLPCCYTGYHSANGIAFGSDGFGYVGVGGRADHGEILLGPNAGQQDVMQPYEASILRFSPDGSTVEVYATGFRNPYDIAWDGNGQLWATDNTPDFDPPERFHRVVPGGVHGYPYYECDVCFSPPEGVTVIPPLVTFAPSSSPTGVASYLANQFPGYYNSLFVTLWSAFPGAQKVMRIGAGGSAPTNFATGFAAPVDVTVGPDGSLYVADWATGIIFKISYTG